MTLIKDNGSLVMRTEIKHSMFGLCICAVVNPATAASSAEPVKPKPEAQSENSHSGLAAGNWLLRTRLTGLFPVNGSSSLELIGGKIEIPDMFLPDLEIAYFLTDHLSVEGQAGVIRTRPRIVGSIIGDFDIGTIWSAAATASVQYHFLPYARLNPYLGVGISYSHPVSTRPDEGVSDFDVKPQTSLLLQAGADYHITGRWFGNAAAKYMVVPEQVYESSKANFISKTDMVSMGAGIGYRF